MWFNWTKIESHGLRTNPKAIIYAKLIDNAPLSALNAFELIQIKLKLQSDAFNFELKIVNHSSSFSQAS